MDYAPSDRSAVAHTSHTEAFSAATSNARHSSPPARIETLNSLAQPPQVTWVEWDHLRFRVVALENLLVALLAEGTSGRLDRVREAACHVTPRRGCTDHPLTLLAAAQIVHIVERARHVKKNPAEG